MKNESLIDQSQGVIDSTREDLSFYDLTRSISVITFNYTQRYILFISQRELKRIQRINQLQTKGRIHHWADAKCIYGFLLWLTERTMNNYLTKDSNNTCVVLQYDRYQCARQWRTIYMSKVTWFSLWHDMKMQPSPKLKFESSIKMMHMMSSCV